MTDAEERKKTNHERWNVESLKEHFDTVMAGRDELYEQRFRMTKESVEDAKLANDKRLDSMNELRTQLNRQADTFLTKEVYKIESKSVIDKVDVLAKTVYIGLGIWIVLQVVLVFVLIQVFRQ